MKKLIIIGAIFISGCSLLPRTANFDNAEYSLTNKIYTYSEIYKPFCTDPVQTKLNFNNLAALSMELFNYSADIPNNVDTVNLVSILNKMISDANIKFQTEGHTVTYCKLKLDNIEISAGIIKNAIAKKRAI